MSCASAKASPDWTRTQNYISCSALAYCSAWQLAASPTQNQKIIRDNIDMYIKIQYQERSERTSFTTCRQPAYDNYVMRTRCPL